MKTEINMFCNIKSRKYETILDAANIILARIITVKGFIVLALDETF
jgi:hypothetical protein